MLAQLQDAFREGIPEVESECGARGREDTARSRAAWVSCLPALGPAREVLAGLGQAKVGNTGQTASQETWPGLRLG